MYKNSSVNRIFSLIIKEILGLFRAKEIRFLLLVPPTIMFFVFSFAITMEIKKVSLVILNYDHGYHSQEIIKKIVSSKKTFSKIKFIKSYNELKNTIDKQQALAAIVFNNNFSKNLYSNYPTNIQLIFDGRKLQAAQIVNSYLNQIINNYQLELNNNKQIINPAKFNVIVHNWFNPNLNYLWFATTTLSAILPMLLATIVTVLSIAREKELGTFEQLLISPLTSLEILIGKSIPAIILAFLEGIILFLLIIGIFKIPFKGSMLSYSISLLSFIFSIVGVGLFISSISRTQQQAILGCFIFLVPSIILSGFVSPIENMPTWLQHLTIINPMRYALNLFYGIYFKDLSFNELWHNILYLFCIGVSTLTISSWLFKRKIK